MFSRVSRPRRFVLRLKNMPDLKQPALAYHRRKPAGAITALVKNPNPDSILPKPFDRRLLTAVSAAVARAAIQ